MVVLFLTFIKSVLSTYRSGFSYERKISVYQKGFGFCVRGVYIKSEDIYSVNMSEIKELTRLLGYISNLAINSTIAVTSDTLLAAQVIYTQILINISRIPSVDNITLNSDQRYTHDTGGVSIPIQE